MLTKIAVDAMGGDHAPVAEVEGALMAARESRVGVILVGPEDRIVPELQRHGLTYHPKSRRVYDAQLAKRLSIEIVQATEFITMDEPVAQAVRRKKDSSIRVAARLVRDGKAHGLVSAGNTGAVMRRVLSIRKAKHKKS